MTVWNWASSTGCNWKEQQKKFSRAPECTLHTETCCESYRCCARPAVKVVRGNKAPAHSFSLGIYSSWATSQSTFHPRSRELQPLKYVIEDLGSKLTTTLETLHHQNEHDLRSIRVRRVSHRGLWLMLSRQGACSSRLGITNGCRS
jgi:hypothetical protein